MTIYRTVSLDDLLKEVGEDETKKILADFYCGKNEDIDYFIKEKAIVFEKAKYSKTFLVYAQINGKAKLAGFYSLASKKLELGNKRYARKERMHLFGYSNIQENCVSTILIGQLSKNFKDGNDHLITGKLLISLAFERIIELSRSIPVAVVMIDCADEKKVMKFYERIGFNHLFYDEKKKLHCYVLPLSTITDSFLIKS